MQKYVCHRKLSAITAAILPRYNIVRGFMPDLPVTFLKPEQLANPLPSSQAMLSHPAPSHWIPIVFSTRLSQIPDVWFRSSAPALLLQAV